MNDIKRMADYYREFYGSDTDALFDAMLKPSQKLALINPFILKERVLSITNAWQPNALFGNTFYRLPEDCVPRVIDGLLSHYFLDFSSALSPLLLPFDAHMNVLDMCSAPGGKLLVMLSRMLNDVRFTANDISYARLVRLKKVLNEFLPKGVLSAQIRITNKDATYFGLKEKSGYHAILLDAPCSSEAHVVNNERLLKQFAGLTKNLPMRQYSLLSAALLALKPGGFCIYSTCSINKNENEGVIKKLLHKKSHLCELVPFSIPYGDKNEYGVTILPHVHGAGPAFFSLIRRS